MDIEERLKKIEAVLGIAETHRPDIGWTSDKNFRLYGKGWAFIYKHISTINPERWHKTCFDYELHLYSVEYLDKSVASKMIHDCMETAGIKEHVTNMVFYTPDNAYAWGADLGTEDSK